MLPGGFQVGCQAPSSGVERSVYQCPSDRRPSQTGSSRRQHRGRLARVTTTDALTADDTLDELAQHLTAIERLSRAPFNRDRIATHRALALECLDAIALQLAG